MNNLLITFASTIIYFAIILLLETNFIATCWDRVKAAVCVAIHPKKKKMLNSVMGSHADVEDETDRIDRSLKQNSKGGK